MIRSSLTAIPLKSTANRAAKTAKSLTKSVVKTPVTPVADTSFTWRPWMTVSSASAGTLVLLAGTALGLGAAALGADIPFADPTA